MAAPASAQSKPSIVVIWGDDIGQSNVSAYSHGVMGYKTPNIDRFPQRQKADSFNLDSVLRKMQEGSGAN
jgi:hypothetical protein